MAAAGSTHSLIGATIGNYRVVSKLGEGGMGAVYLAEHPLIGKKVALKVLHHELGRDEDVVSRFFNEARAVNEIGHPNIVDVVDYGVVERDGGSVVYFIMEYLDGQSLKTLLERAAPLPVERALGIAVQIGDALAASHEKGVIHRDLKPDNVYLVARGRERDFVKVLDFGIAKLTGRDPGNLGRTRSGIVMGTPTYMAPEQCEGRRDVDPRADVYSLGVILYEMLAGKVPFTGEGYGEVILQHVTRPPLPPSRLRGGIPPAVEAIVLRALAKKRQDRFGSMEQLVQALRDPAAFLTRGPASFTDDDPSWTRATVPSRRVVEAPVVGSAPTMSATPSTLGHSAAELVTARSRAPVIAASAVVVLGILGGGAFFLLRGDTPPSSGEERPAVTATAPTPAPVTPPAAAPAPAPAAAAPDAPATVKVSVSSQPPGAELRVGDRVHGKTPLTVDLPRSDDAVTLTLTLAGYRAESKTVRPSRDTELVVALDRSSAPSRRPAPVPRGGKPVQVPIPPPPAAPQPAPVAAPVQDSAPPPLAPQAPEPAVETPPAPAPEAPAADPPAPEPPAAEPPAAPAPAPDDAEPPKSGE